MEEEEEEKVDCDRLSLLPRPTTRPNPEGDTDRSICPFCHNRNAKPSKA